MHNCTMPQQVMSDQQPAQIKDAMSPERITYNDVKEAIILAPHSHVKDELQDLKQRESKTNLRLMKAGEANVNDMQSRSWRVKNSEQPNQS